MARKPKFLRAFHRLLAVGMIVMHSPHLVVASVSESTIATELQLLQPIERRLQTTEPPTFSNRPSSMPSSKPSSMPSLSTRPSSMPSSQPSSMPSLSTRPSSMPASQSSSMPSLSSPMPSLSSPNPSYNPSIEPSSSPTEEPSPTPSAQPSSQPSPDKFTTDDHINVAFNSSALFNVIDTDTVSKVPQAPVLRHLKKNSKARLVGNRRAIDESTFPDNIILISVEAVEAVESALKNQISLGLNENQQLLSLVLIGETPVPDSTGVNISYTTEIDELCSESCEAQAETSTLFQTLSSFIEATFTESFPSLLEASLNECGDACNGIPAAVASAPAMQEPEIAVVVIPSSEPSSPPSDHPSVSTLPTMQPSLSTQPSISSFPTQTLTTNPSGEPSISSMPSEPPSISIGPSAQPTGMPSLSVQPSSQLSSQPSLSPSLEPSMNPSILLDTIQDNLGEDAYGLCQGDCDLDTDCMGDLVCFQRSGFEPVPGCSGLGLDRRDYCFVRPPMSLLNIGNNLGADAYGLCDGDCDEDSDCMGALRCFMRSSGRTDPVFGCDGVGIPGLDYCIDRPPHFLFDIGNNFGTGMYGLCEGDCDADDDCIGDLLCARRNDLSTIPGCFGEGRSGNDYCRPLVLPTQNPTAPLVPSSSPIPSSTPTTRPTQNPTSPPTSASPTVSESPTFPTLPLMRVGNNGMVLPEFLDRAFPLGLCEGDCDTDDECEDSFRCFQRDGREEIPGCSGLGERGTDYCFSRPPDLLFNIGNNMADGSYGLCEGDCDENADCMMDLCCFRRSSGSLDPIPGCTGVGDAGLDYCYRRPPNSLFDIGNNLGTGMYGNCDGDCDSDSDCQGDLLCFRRRSGELTPVPGCTETGRAGNDYCFNRDPNSLFDVGNNLGTDSYGLCDGDCDADDDCMDGLECFMRDGTDPVPGCEGTGTENFDYCVPVEMEIVVTTISTLNINGIDCDDPNTAVFVPFLQEAMDELMNEEVDNTTQTIDMEVEFCGITSDTGPVGGRRLAINQARVNAKSRSICRSLNCGQLAPALAEEFVAALRNGITAKKTSGRVARNLIIRGLINLFQDLVIETAELAETVTVGNNPTDGSPTNAPKAITPTQAPTGNPSSTPSSHPSGQPTISGVPSSQPSTQPSSDPSTTLQPSMAPSETPPVLVEGFVTSPQCIDGFICLQNTEFGVQDSTRYNIDLDIQIVDANQGEAFAKARDRWMEIITGDLPTATVANNDDCVNDPPALVDDLFICGILEPIDGPSGVLGSAGPTQGRRDPVTNRLTSTRGNMRFDSADVANLISSGTFDEVILHEMAHIIGIGTLWVQNGITDGTTFEYLGSGGIDVWTNDWGCDSSAPPVETDFGPGTQGGHWDEACLQNELLTGFLGGRGIGSPISRLTVATLQDIGYEVNFDAADAYDGSDTTCCNPTDASVTGLTRSKRNLSDAGMATAVAYGQRMLEESKLPADVVVEDYMGDQLTVVLMEEDGEMYHVVVTPTMTGSKP